MKKTCHKKPKKGRCSPKSPKKYNLNKSLGYNTQCCRKSNEFSDFLKDNNLSISEGAELYRDTKWVPTNKFNFKSTPTFSFTEPNQTIPRPNALYSAASLALPAVKPKEELPNLSNIMYMSHVTNINSIKPIFQSGYLLSALEAYEQKIQRIGNFSANDNTNQVGDEFPGIYMSIVGTKSANEKIRYFSETDVNLILCKELIYRKDWHWNRRDSNGFFSEKNTIMGNDNVLQLSKEQTFDNSNELIFHNRIPVSWIQEIIVQNKEQQTFLLNILKQLNLDRLIPVTIETRWPKRNYKCRSDVSHMMMKNCFFVDTYERYDQKPYSDSLKYYKFLAQQCEIPEREIDRITTPQEAEVLIRKYVQPYWNKYFKQY